MGDEQNHARAALATRCGAHALHDGLTDLLYVLLPVLAQAFGLNYSQVGLIRFINDAVDKVRRQEQQKRPELTRNRYLWLKNPDNPKSVEAETIGKLMVKKLNSSMVRRRF